MIGDRPKARRPKRPKRPEPGQGRQALLNAVIEVVARKGLRGLTYRAVAEEAGVTHASVTHHFHNRDRLILEAYAASTRSIADVSHESEELEDFGSDLATVIGQDKELFAFQYELLLEGIRRAALNKAAEQTYAETLSDIERRLKALGCADPDGSLAKFVLAAVDGLILHQVVFGDAESTERSVRILQEVLAGRRSSKRSRR